MVKKLIEFTDLKTYLEIAGAAKVSGKKIGEYIEYIHRISTRKKTLIGDK